MHYLQMVVDMEYLGMFCKIMYVCDLSTLCPVSTECIIYLYW